MLQCVAVCCCDLKYRLHIEFSQTLYHFTYNNNEGPFLRNCTYLRKVRHSEVSGYRNQAGFLLPVEEILENLEHSIPQAFHFEKTPKKLETALFRGLRITVECRSSGESRNSKISASNSLGSCIL